MQLVSNAYFRQLLEIQKHNAFYYYWDIQSILKFNLLSLFIGTKSWMRLDGWGRGGKGWRKEITHVCMCVYVHAYRNINLYIHVCLCMLTHVLVFCIMFVCAHRHMYLCLCMYMYEFMYAHTCECILYTYMFVCVCTWGCVHTCVYT